MPRVETRDNAQSRLWDVLINGEHKGTIMVVNPFGARYYEAQVQLDEHRVLYTGGDTLPEVVQLIGIHAY